MIRFYKTPGLLKHLLPRFTWQRISLEKELYLTFDDGPIPELTPWVLEQLAHYKAKATFFCVGENVVKHPDIALRIVEQGHGLANHTFNHLKGWQTPLAIYLDNTQRCQRELEKLPALNTSRKLFRPPYGRISIEQASVLRKDYELIMWDVLTNDYDVTLSPELCLEKSIKNTSAGSIIVFHDSLKARRNMYYALPRFLEHFTALGYTFQVL